MVNEFVFFTYKKYQKSSVLYRQWEAIEDLEGGFNLLKSITGGKES